MKMNIIREKYFPVISGRKRLKKGLKTLALRAPEVEKLGF